MLAMFAASGCRLGVLALVLAACLPGCNASSSPAASGRPIEGSRVVLNPLAQHYEDDVVYTSQRSANDATVYRQKGDSLRPLQTLSSGIAVPGGTVATPSGWWFLTNSGDSDVLIYRTTKRGPKGPVGKLRDGAGIPVNVDVTPDRNLVAVANTRPRFGAKSGSVALYSPGASTPTNVLKGTKDPVSLAFDATGNIYVADFNGGVNIYEPGQSQPIRIIRGGRYGYYIVQPRLVAVDPSGNLYVANGPEAVGSQDNVFALFVYPPGKSEPSTVYEIGLPRALLVAHGRLYIACGAVKSAKIPGSVEVFRFGSNVPLIITQGLHTPDGLAVDSSGNLYVANLNGGNVTVYHAGRTSPFRTISNGIHSPRALAIGSEGNLYVSNLYANTVTVYKPGQSDPFLIIKQSINDPVALTLNAAPP